ILRHKAPRPRLRRADRAFWVILARIWNERQSALMVVGPETVLRWHRQGFPDLIRLIRREQTASLTDLAHLYRASAPCAAKISTPLACRRSFQTGTIKSPLTARLL